MLFINKICLNQLTHIEKKITAANALISTGQGSVVELVIKLILINVLINHI
jgi:hypothetical protein